MYFAETREPALPLLRGSALQAFVSLGLDGWATNAPQSATEHISRTARMLSSVTARFGYVAETASGVACLVAWLRVAV